MPNLRGILSKLIELSHAKYEFYYLYLSGSTWLSLFKNKLQSGVLGDFLYDPASQEPGGNFDPPQNQ